MLLNPLPISPSSNRSTSTGRSSVISSSSSASEASSSISSPMSMTRLAPKKRFKLMVGLKQQDDCAKDDNYYKRTQDTIMRDAGRLILDPASFSTTSQQQEQEQLSVNSYNNIGNYVEEKHPNTSLTTKGHAHNTSLTLNQVRVHQKQMLVRSYYKVHQRMVSSKLVEWANENSSIISFSCPAPPAAVNHNGQQCNKAICFNSNVNLLSTFDNTARVTDDASSYYLNMRQALYKNYVKALQSQKQPKDRGFPPKTIDVKQKRHRKMKVPHKGKATTMLASHHRAARANLLHSYKKALLSHQQLLVSQLQYCCRQA